MNASALSSHVGSLLGDAVLSATTLRDEVTITVPRASIVSTLEKLRDDPKCLFEVLIDICGVDYPERAERFEIVYHLLSPRLNQRIRVKTTTDEVAPVASINDVFPAANWFEREV